MVVLALAVLAAQGKAECVPVDGPAIQARHLAASIPAFAALAPETALAASPFPGAQRNTFRQELLTWLGGTATPAALPDRICIAWKTRLLDHHSILRAMTDSRVLPAGSFHLVDVSRVPVPDGDLEFTASGLGAASKDGVATWRGTLRYAKGRTLLVWARIQHDEAKECVVAARALRVGATVRPEDTATRRQYAAPGSTCIDSLAEMERRVVRRSISPGAVIAKLDLVLPPDVRRGQTVELEMRSGRASLKLPAEAVEDGRIGQHLTVRNPDTGKSIEALLVDKARALADTSMPGNSRRVGRGATK